MSKKMLYTDASDWGCDMHGRDLSRRGNVTRRGFHAWRRACAGGDFGHSLVPDAFPSMQR